MFRGVQGIQIYSGNFTSCLIRSREFTELRSPGVQQVGKRHVFRPSSQLWRMPEHPCSVFQRGQHLCMKAACGGMELTRKPHFAPSLASHQHKHLLKSAFIALPVSAQGFRKDPQSCCQIEVSKMVEHICRKSLLLRGTGSRRKTKDSRGMTF